MANKKISELDQTLNLSDQADFPLSQDNGGEPTTFRAKLTQIATKIAEAITFSNLKTGNKQLVSAVNQTISNLADDFNTTAGSTYAKDDCVLYNGVLYQCINNSGTTSGTFIDADWTAIKAVDVGSGGGGGGGTTDYDDLSNKPQVNSIELVGNKSLDDLGIMPASLSKTVSGAIASFTDGADNIPVKSLVSQIVAVESGSGEKSPDNPYTISGFDNGIITRCGKNLVPETYVRRSGYTQPTATINNGVITFTDYSAGGRYVAYNVKTNIGTKYTIKFASGTNLTQVGYIESDTEPTEWLGFKNTLTANTPTTITATKEWLQIYIEISANNATLNYLQVEIGETATTYETYNGNTYTFAFGQTVFGGYFDNKGNLVVIWVGYNMADLQWSQNTYSQSIYNGTLPSRCKSANILSFKSTEYVSTDSTTALTLNNSVAISSARTVVYCHDERYTNVTDFKNGVTALLVYELETPITLAITSQDIPTLLGNNNIFSNTGDVEVEYYTDNADEIAEVAKATASTPLHNYSTDEQIVGTWIDGSTLYEKTFDLTSVSLPNATWTTNVLGTSTSNIKIRKFSGTFNLSDGGAFVNEPYADYLYFRSTTDYFTAVLNDDGNDLNLRPQINGVTMTAGVCTIQYIKTSSNTRNLNLSKGVEETELAEETEEQEEQER